MYPERVIRKSHLSMPADGIHRSSGEAMRNVLHARDVPMPTRSGTHSGIKAMGDQDSLARTRLPGNNQRTDHEHDNHHHKRGSDLPVPTGVSHARADRRP